MKINQKINKLLYLVTNSLKDDKLHKLRRGKLNV